MMAKTDDRREPGEPASAGWIQCPGYIDQEGRGPAMRPIQIPIRGIKYCRG